ncbi:carbohydrate ABC transporter permease [Paenibacillus qinlingensis]|uniref:ABC-type glycerol-3-phosphate transport system permease component n=1 Tax=Paenibacillus qinlingensis TaxID=1837343 RepID=A0ABU1NSY4_9BACL|nr:carbohydrate ABC transporter permease [Paenibacillus qinlingensis]MDR6550593.1 ABC-type glycerol-3-phosphate transport system permease component [Paenibacillus qinlingensis]
MKSSLGETSFRMINYIVLLLLSVTMILPIIHVFAISLSDPAAVDAHQVQFLPVEITSSAWTHILAKVDLWRSLGVNIFVTVVGTLLSLLFTSLLAYPLARKDFRIRHTIMMGIVFTMIFQAPMIPYFLTIKSLGLLDSIWVLILPSTISAFNLIILRTFFQQLPYELEESARIDGCTDYGILFRVVIPLSKPALATMGLFYAVIYWNMFYHAILFIRNPNLYPLQLKLRETMVNTDLAANLNAMAYNSQTLQAATIIFVTLPILLVYPFIQKYFVQGATLGAVKE